MVRLAHPRQPVVAIPFDGRSDYVGFTDRGIPAGGVFAGAEGVKTANQERIFGGDAGSWYDPCYHQACDDLTTVLSGVPPLEAEGLAVETPNATDADKALAAQKMRGGARRSLHELGAAATYATWYFSSVRGPVRHRRADGDHRAQGGVQGGEGASPRGGARVSGPHPPGPLGSTSHRRRSIRERRLKLGRRGRATATRPVRATHGRSACGILGEREMSDAVVPRGACRRTDVEDVLGHGGQHDRVGAAVCDKDRDGQAGEDVVGVDLAGEERAAHLGRHDHVPAQRRAPSRPGSAAARCRPPGSGEWPRCSPARSGAAGARVLEQAGADVIEAGRAQHGGADEVDRGDPALAVGAQVVGDHEAAVGPRDQDRALEPELLDHRGEVVGPELRVDVGGGVAGLARTCRGRGGRR